MKHKKLFIIMAVVVIMATFTISTFAEVPTEAINGFYFEYDGYDGNNQHNNAQTINLIGYNTAYEEIAFFKVGEEYYFFVEQLYNDGDNIRYKVTGTGDIDIINIDVIDETYSEPEDVIIYWKQEVEQILLDNGEIFTVQEDTFTPPLENNNIYADIYSMVKQYIFGGAELTANQDLVATLTATWSCILLVMLPFIIVWGIFKLFVR